MSKPISFYVALWAAKLSVHPLRWTGHDATNFPGKIAKKICPLFFQYIEKPSRIIGITGTNGKTTTTNLIKDILEANGYEPLCNVLGANIETGIITTFIHNSGYHGKKKKDLAVLEIDERSAVRIFPYVQPQWLTITNLFRDSYKRNATCEFIAGILEKYIPDTTTLVVNGEDIISSHLKERNQRIVYGVDIDKHSHVPHPTIINDARTCPKCGSLLTYDYLRYHHIGVAKCGHCGNASYPFDVKVIARKEKSLYVDIQLKSGKTIHCKMPGERFSDMDNTLAAIACCEDFGLRADQIEKAVNSLRITETRFVQFEANGRKIVTLMAKGQNPVANTGVYNDIRLQEGKKEVILFIEDLADRADGSENFAWIYSADFEFFNDTSFTRFIIAGPRNLDIQLRMLLAGIAKEKIILCDKEEEAVALVDKESDANIYLLYDTTSVDLGHRIGKEIADYLKGDKK